MNVGAAAARKTALLKAETLQHAILASANFAIIATDANGVICLFNAGAERMLGYAAGDVLDKISASDIRDPEEMIAHAEGLSREFATTIAPGFAALIFKAARGIEDKYELTYIRKDGSRFPASVSITALRDDTINITGYLLIGTDNSAPVARTRESAIAGMASEMQEKTDALNREIEERQRIFETSLDLILVLDRAGIFVRVSSSSMAILGYEPEELIGRSVAEFVHPDDLENIQKELRSARRGRLLHNFDARYLHKEGRPVTLAWAGVWSEPEQQHFFFGRNVTKEKAAEEMFRLAVESCPNGMVMIDAAGKIVLVNGEIERLFGYQREDLISQPVELLVPERLRRQQVWHRDSSPAHRECARAGASRDLFGLRKDGTEFPIELGLNSIQTREGLLALGVIIDVSERKRMERLKDEFVSTVSHELRTPLTSIAGALGLLIGNAGGALPDVAARLIAIAHTNSQRLVRLINDILDIEKIESGHVVFHLKRVEVLSLVEQAIEANRGFAEGYGVRVRLDAAPATEAVRADPDRLVQVVTNLLSNAIKFSPAGEEVVMGIEPQTDMVRISVRDHGPGIPADFKSHIFEKFAQADATDTRQKGGTGLGLSIVKQIVSRLGGEVAFDEAPGGGTVFRVDLPSWDHVAAREIDLHGGSEAARVLLCESDPDTAMALRERLRNIGCTTDFAYTAEDALKRAATTPYAAILVDLELPDGDGTRLILRLREQPQYQNTPIVVVSADPDRRRDDPKLSKLNVLDWLAKPLDIERLVRVLDKPAVRGRNGRLHILHVDDDRDVLAIVAQTLASIADVISVDSIASARQALKENHFDLAILDIVLGSGGGLDLLPDLRDSMDDPIPVIIFAQGSNPVSDAQVEAALNKSQVSIDSLLATVRDRLELRPTRTPEDVA